MYNLTIKHVDGRQQLSVASYDKALRYVKLAIESGSALDPSTLNRASLSFMQKVQARGIMTLSTDKGFFTVSSWGQSRG